MNTLIESIKMAFSALSSNKLRAMLTTLGVVIGITTVLLMGWFLSGLDNALEQTLAIFGDDILYVDKMDWTGKDWQEQRNRNNITYDQFLKAKQRIRTAEYVVPTARRGADKVQYGDLQLNGTLILGVTHEYIDLLGGALTAGRFFNEVEDNTGAAVAVLGSNLVENLFPHGDPIGKMVKIDGIPFTVISTMPKRGTLGMDMVDNQIIIPLKQFFSLYGNQSRIIINVKAGGTGDKLENVRYETEGVMRQVRSLAPGVKNDFAVNTQEAFRQQLDQIRYVVYGVGIAMTGLSFLVGSIGIMNIMFVSVTERTKEIGIRKALGATRGSILLQFLAEAIALCMAGSVIAFIITAVTAYFGAGWLESKYSLTFLTRTIPVSQIFVAVIVSVVVGVMAGIIPANRGARMDPVEALRSE
ncbi:MAG: ABC transporter permease [Candidatus Kapaibacterium sp.]